MAPTKGKKEKATEAEKPTAKKVKKPRKTASESEEEMEGMTAPADPKDDMIARLQEQVRLLTVEVKTLRKHVGQPQKVSPKPAETPRRKGSKANLTAEPLATPKARRASTGSSKPKEKGCSCKGNCANKICGCVKKNFYCLPTCKCSDQCLNQDQNEGPEDAEDKENDPINAEPIMESASNSEESHSEESSPEIAKPARAKVAAGRMSLMDSPDSDEAFNPMAPRRQLVRSPPQQKPTQKMTEKPKSYTLSEIPLPPPKDEPEEMEQPPPEIHEAHVDWETHMKELVQCSKCKRGFYPYRLKTHEKSCIKR